MNKLKEELILISSSLTMKTFQLIINKKNLIIKSKIQDSCHKENKFSKNYLLKKNN